MKFVVSSTMASKLRWEDGKLALNLAEAQCLTGTGARKPKFRGSLLWGDVIRTGAPVQLERRRLRSNLRGQIWSRFLDKAPGQFLWLIEGVPKSASSSRLRALNVGS